MSDSLISKFKTNVPRYTSYPTAPHFNDTIDNNVYASWLQALGSKDSLSLYIHIPYCDRLCWFCACNTKQILKYQPVKTYLAALKAEIANVGSLVSKEALVTALHFGGGSPTLLAPEDLIDLMAWLRDHFRFAGDAEISVEMDPNDLDVGRYDALAKIGMTRASLGVQDFDVEVQKAINRLQTFEQTRSVVEAVRARGVRSVNCDIVYGLPLQTLDKLQATVACILSLDPDRIALFGYAHVPWMKKHQTMIDEAALPGPDLRFSMMTRAADMIAAAGYVPIGIDHFAKPGDSLAVAHQSGTMQRNFQGYSDDPATALIGLGASSIGKFPQGHVQNIGAAGLYQTAVEKQGLAVMRGIVFSRDDLVRSHVIERIMCDFSFSFDELRALFGQDADAVILQARTSVAKDGDGMVEIVNGTFRLTKRAKPFARSIAALFDAYLGNGIGRHSVAV